MGLPDIVTQVNDWMARRIKTLPCHRNRASAMGHDCIRHLVYCLTNWQDAQAHSVDTERIFEEGRVHERAIDIQLALAGIELYHQQDAVDFPQQQLTGHVDGCIIVDGKTCPVEIKTMHPGIWDGIFYRGSGRYQWGEVSEKFKGKPWLRKYPAQLQLYMLGKNTDIGIMLCKNKSNGALAQIDMELDYDYAERLLKKAEEINAYVEQNVLPDRMPYDPQVCTRCEFVHICLPDLDLNKPLEPCGDDFLLELLKTRQTHEEGHKEYQRAHKLLLQWVKDHDGYRWLCGGYLVEKKVSASGMTRVKVSWA